MLTFDDVLISENGAGGVFLSGAAAGRAGTGSSVDDDDDDGAGSGGVKSLLTNCIVTKNRLANVCAEDGHYLRMKGCEVTRGCASGVFSRGGACIDIGTCCLIADNAMMDIESM